MKIIKSDDITYIILAINLNISRIKSTVNSILRRDKRHKVICIVPKKTNIDDIKEIKAICPVYKGKDTISSLVNSGLKHTIGWGIIVKEGVWVSKNIEKNYNKFYDSDKDIFFLVGMQCNIAGIPLKVFSEFSDCNISGITIHSDTFKNIGDFPETDNFENDRLIWQCNGIEKEYKFKGVLGPKLV